ncbi:MAG: hypothetical protein DRP93_07340, partial [Candidatus Neomarinimicrobiota bacterium]
DGESCGYNIVGGSIFGNTIVNSSNRVSCPDVEGNFAATTYLATTRLDIESAGTAGVFYTDYIEIYADGYLEDGNTGYMKSRVCAHDDPEKCMIEVTTFGAFIGDVNHHTTYSIQWQSDSSDPLEDDDWNILNGTYAVAGTCDYWARYPGKFYSTLRFRLKISLTYELYGTFANQMTVKIHNT